MRGRRAQTSSFVPVRHAPVLLLSIIYLFAITTRATNRPLWFDEIFTHTIANFDGPLAIVRSLLHGADIHPPLDYLIRHYSMALFGSSELALRLPSIAAVLGGAICIYIFVLRRCSVLPALAAFAFFLSTMALRYAYEGRGYALMLASMCASLLAWQFATEKPSLGRLAILALCLAIGPFSHYYGALNYAPIIAGEAWRTWGRRKVCWPIVAAIGLSMTFLGLLAPFALNASVYSATFWTKFGPSTSANMFGVLLRPAVPALIGILIISSTLVALRLKSKPAAAQPGGLAGHEVLAGVALCLVPFMIHALAVLVTGAITIRYAVTTVIGPALLLAYLTHLAGSWRRDIAIAIAACSGVWVAAYLVNHVIQLPQRPEPIAARTIAFIDNAETPVVMADAREFIVAHFYLSESRRRKVHYPTDTKSALKYLGFDNDERSFKDLKRFAPLNIAELCQFTARHKTFLVLGGKVNWLIPKLVDGGATLTLLSTGRNIDSVYRADTNGWRGCD